MKHRSSPAAAGGFGRATTTCPHGCSWSYTGWSERAALIERELHAMLCSLQPAPEELTRVAPMMCRYRPLGCTWHLLFAPMEASGAEICRREHEYRCPRRPNFMSAPRE